MLISQFFDNPIAIADYLVLAGIPDSVRPAGVFRIEGVVYVTVGRWEGNLLLLVFAELEEIYFGEKVLYRSY